MKLAVIVTEFPKTTETFILRDLMVFLEQGVDLRVYHLTPWRKSEILHAFGQRVAEHTHHISLTGKAAVAALGRHPAEAAKTAAAIAKAQGMEPVMAAKSLALIPASLAIADELAEWGATHVHAEFAGHPATAAWIINRHAGISYSVSCRAHDIFRSQRLLSEKFKAAAAVRSVSSYARRFLADKVDGVGLDDITVIHSSVDIASIPRLGPPPRERFSILCVGALQSRKGIDVLLDALAGFDRDDWVLKLAGDGPEKNRLTSQIRRLGLEDKVQILGKQTWDQVAALYEQASVCVAPSVIGPKGRTEGIPNVMIEAMAFRRPVISTRVSGLPELIKDGETGRLVAPGDPVALRRALTDIYDSPKAALRMADAGRVHVANEFDLRQNAVRQLRMFAAASPQIKTEVVTPHLRLVKSA